MAEGAPELSRDRLVAGALGSLLGLVLLVATINLVIAGVALDKHLALNRGLWVWLAGAALAALGAAAFLLNKAPARFSARHAWWTGGLLAGLGGGGFLGLHLYVHWLAHWP
jgi:hypothetical protein